jgi:hypothetical protein
MPCMSLRRRGADRYFGSFPKVGIVVPSPAAWLLPELQDEAHALTTTLDLPAVVGHGASVEPTSDGLLIWLPSSAPRQGPDPPEMRLGASAAPCFSMRQPATRQHTHCWTAQHSTGGRFPGQPPRVAGYRPLRTGTAPVSLAQHEHAGLTSQCTAASSCGSWRLTGARVCGRSSAVAGPGLWHHIQHSGGPGARVQLWLRHRQADLRNRHFTRVGLLVVGHVGPGCPVFLPGEPNTPGCAEGRTHLEPFFSVSMHVRLVFGVQGLTVHMRSTTT